MVKYCKKCGAKIDSKWKKYCYKCYHQNKGNYNPKKLQKRYGGCK